MVRGFEEANEWSGRDTSAGDLCRKEGNDEGSMILQWINWLLKFEIPDRRAAQQAAQLDAAGYSASENYRAVSAEENYT